MAMIELGFSRSSNGSEETDSYPYCGALGDCSFVAYIALGSLLEKILAYRGWKAF